MRMRVRNVEPPHHMIEGYLQMARLNEVASIKKFHLLPDLISALVERWRPECHTFHFPCGECTVTLEDVALHLGLPINGLVVTGTTDLNVQLIQDMCEACLGERPEVNDFIGCAIKLSWLERLNSTLAEDADQQTIERFARVYMLRLLGCKIMPDKTSCSIHGKYLPLLLQLDQIGQYSWGSACLTMLYRGLCRASRKGTKEVSGCLILLQSWAWHRLPFLCPVDRPITFPLCAR